MKHNPLSRCAASAFSRSAAHRGMGDGASAAGRPLRGACWAGSRQFHAVRVTHGAMGH